MFVPHDAQETSKTHLRTRLQQIDNGLPFMGVLAVMGAILFVQKLSGQIIVATLGILMIEAGVWRLAHRFLPNQRQYHALREEVNGFHTLVRQLNAAALNVKKRDVPETRQVFEHVYEAMQRSVDRMTVAAGQTDAARSGTGAAHALADRHAVSHEPQC